jgi:membrane protease subunit HflK
MKQEKTCVFYSYGDALEMTGNNDSQGPWGIKKTPPSDLNDKKRPWPNKNGGGSGGDEGPDFDRLLEEAQGALKRLMPSQFSEYQKLPLIFLAFVVLWLLSGFYIVGPKEVGLNLIFGKYSGKTGEGLQYNFPWPIGSVITPQVTTVNTLSIGSQMRLKRSSNGAASTTSYDESLMLTGDENIVDIDFTVQWQVSPSHPENYVFNLKNPDGTIKAVAEGAMRDVIGQRNIQSILTTDRGAIETDVRQLMQDTLNAYGAGVEIRLVQLQKVDPPAQVMDAFRDVQAARQDQDRARNEAEAYASRIVPEAKGEAAQIVQAAEGYKAQKVAEAEGAVSRFNQVYASYKEAPEVTRQRLFLETMEKVLGGSEKIMMEPQGSGVVPFLPLTATNK